MQFDTHFILSSFHILFVVPFLLWIGFHRADTAQWVYMALFTIGLVILLYHGIKLFFRLQARSSYAWVNAIHVGLIAPLLLYIGYHQKDTPRQAYEMLLLISFAALGYHMFSLVRMLQVYHHAEDLKN